ncbi:Spy0128 family protein [Streptococcus suis]|uniref:Spy0128 family protein n=1 Tax=Streptococcus suis TaxID=1307 RepID=UPI004044BD9C
MARLRKLFAILLVFLGGIFSTQIVSADTVNITVSNTKLTPEKSGYKQSIEFSFDFAVPESAKKGDTTVISLPNELTFQRNESFDVYAPDGQKVAKAVADTRTKKLTITYTDYVDKKNDITGHMAFNVVVDSNVVKKAQEVSATIMINGSSPSITIGGGKINYLGPTGEPDTLNFWKYGTTSGTNTIQYYVHFNTAKESVSDVVIADTIKSPGLQYVEGSFRISEGDYYKNDINYWALGNSTDVTNNYNVELSNDKTSFKIKFGNISRGYTIAYKVKANYNLVNGEVVENNITYSSGTTKKSDYTSKFAYQGASGTASGYNYSLSIKKVNEEGVALAGAEFTVIRKATGQVVGTLTTGVDGTATIAGLLKDEYILREVTPPSGYVAGADVVVNPADFDSTSKIASKTIVNKKKPSEPAKVVLKATKILEGRALADQEFEFVLTDQYGREIETAKNDQYGDIKFKELTFDEEGTYDYTIKEKKANTSDENGITYDEQPVEVAVVVSKDPTGKLTATVSYANDDNTFKNIYTPTPVDVELEVTKKLTGRKLLEGEFEFVLTENRFPDPTPSRMPARNTVVPTENIVRQKVTNTADGKVKFAPITYDSRGAYQYTIEETNAGKTIDGVTYDSLKVEVTVVVTDDGKGRLVAEVFYSKNTEFNNIYKTSKAKAELAVKKTLTGRELKEDEFEFVLKNEANDEVATAKNDKDGNVKFKELIFDKAGTYTYTISEKNGGTTDKGVTYDGKTITATVTVTDNGSGELSAAVSYSDETPFNNTYAVSGTRAELAVKKTLTGRELKEDEFEFVLKNEANEEVATAKNDKDGNVKFKELIFDKAGTYTYTISEKNGGTTDKGVTYDGKTITATVTVTDNGSGELSAAVSYSDETPFNNTYAVSGTRAELAVKKTLTGRELKKDEFEFVLKNEANDEVATAKNDKDGNVKFKELTFDKAGTYTYTVTEVVGGDTAIIYDSLEIKVTVVVTDDGEGKLVAKVEYPEDIEFNNEYVEPTTTTTTVEPTTTTTTEEPTTTTTTEEPTTTTTTEEPTTTTTTEEPTTTTTTEEPTTTTTTEEPTTTTTTEEPTTTTTTEEPTTTTTTEEPTTTTTTEEPTTTTTTEEPTTTTTTEEPTTTTTTEEPTTTTTTEEPTTTTTTEEPTTTTTTEEPTTTTTTEEPTTTTTTEEPMTTTTSEKTRKTALPSTGDKGNIWVAIAGFVALITIVVMVYYRKSKNA